MLSHKELIAKMRSQPGYKEKYDEAAPEFELLHKMLEARKRAGMTQEQVAEKMGTKATAITRLESANSQHSPKVETLRKYAEAVGCRLNIELIPD